MYQVNIVSVLPVISNYGNFSKNLCKYIAASFHLIWFGQVLMLSSTLVFCVLCTLLGILKVPLLVAAAGGTSSLAWAKNAAPKTELFNTGSDQSDCTKCLHIIGGRGY